MNSQGLLRFAIAGVVILTGTTVVAQNVTDPKQVPVPETPRLPSHSLRGLTVPDVPEHPDPPARDFYDPKYKVRFHIPAGWNFEKKDGVLSNFKVETRSAHARSEVRGVATINYNPWPPTTFAGAIFYYSVVPRSNTAMCSRQLRGKGVKALPDAEIGSTSFRHAHDQHGRVCTENRDEVFVSMRGNACLRFDLVVNTFCSDTSGAMQINDAQLKDVQTRLADILGSIRLDGK